MYPINVGTYVPYKSSAKAKPDSSFGPFHHYLFKFKPVSGCKMDLRDHILITHELGRPYLTY